MSLRASVIGIASLVCGACVGPLSIEYADAVDAGPPDAGSVTVDDGGAPLPPSPIPSVDGGSIATPDAGTIPTIDAGTLAPLAPPEARYHTFDEVDAFVHELGRRHPDRVLVDRYGQSASGRPLNVLRISDHVGVDEGEPEVLINYAIHGDEIITVECALALLYELVERYDEDPRIRAVVDDHDLYVVPVVSPDGFAARSREVEGVDPNRQFPYPEAPSRASIGIIAAAVRFFEAHNFSGSLDYHAFGQLVLLPYGASFEQPPTYAELMGVARDLASVAGYEPTQISYLFGEPAIGGSVDYYLWRGGGTHLGIELATEKAPPTSQIATIRGHATEMGLRFIEAL
ncbi:MAG: hypothetical protein H6719_35045 [Sandaracinaceae bacterium]|nr:hypothetical protein [Sandaracinaceae bacterium]